MTNEEKTKNDAPVDSAKSDRVETKPERLKRLAAERKALAEEEKSIRLELDANKGERKEARRIASKKKTAALDARTELAKQTRALNNAMLAKSMKNNLDSFQEILGSYSEAAQGLIDASEAYIEALNELEKLG